jgi:hypothetical protein
MHYKSLPIEHRLLARLLEVDEEAARQFPRQDCDPGLGGIGLLLTPKLANGGYTCTPENSRSFAHTGGEGVHFSFLGELDEIDDASPVIVTIPMAFDHPNFIVGENLYDFLCFGIHRGFFALEQLGYNFEETFTAYTNPMWQPSVHRHDWVGLTVDDHTLNLLRLLIERFGLVPWKNAKIKFEQLQEAYLGKLRVSTEDK